MEVPDAVVGTDRTTVDLPIDRPLQAKYGSVLGQTVRTALDRPEAIPIPPGQAQLGSVEMHCTNFTSICPVTGQPDFGSVTLRFQPKDHILESKSLKLYLLKFRDGSIPGMAEGLSRLIADEVAEVLKPHYLTVTVKQEPRGDIAIEASSTWNPFAEYIFDEAVHGI